jgi:hypothetical protein
MMRLALSMLSVAAVLAVSGLPAAQAQTTAAAEFNQALLDGWLRAVPAMAALNASTDAPQDR